MKQWPNTKLLSLICAGLLAAGATLAHLSRLSYDVSRDFNGQIDNCYVQRFQEGSGAKDDPVYEEITVTCPDKTMIFYDDKPFGSLDEIKTATTSNATYDRRTGRSIMQKQHELFQAYSNTINSKLGLQ